MTRSERILFALLATYVCCLLGLHALYYAGLFTAIERDPSVMIHATRTFFVTSFFILICVQIARARPFGLLVVAAASYSGATFIEDFLVIESSFFLPEHPMAGLCQSCAQSRTDHSTRAGDQYVHSLSKSRVR